VGVRTLEVSAMGSGNIITIAIVIILVVVILSLLGIIPLF
jgi:hypothetical protein